MADSFVFEVYHDASRLTPFDWETLSTINAVNESPSSMSLGNSPTIDIRTLKAIRLGDPERPNLSLAAAFAGRRSAARFSQTPITRLTLSTLLHYSYGLNGSIAVAGHSAKPLSFCPSPGGLYSLSVLVEVRISHDIDRGLYYYDPATHSLGELAANLEDLKIASFQGDALSATSANVWFLSRFDRLSFKYGERAYRFTLLETGHAAQNCLLVASALSLPARAFGGFFDDHVRTAMNVTDFGLEPLYYVGVG